ncbi:hypothetical protein EOM86_07820 [Candidatus Nomurabacteria bacterium]|nr:hypothetical protein [Candidatus Nomurabacteria bacterium]
MGFDLSGFDVSGWDYRFETQITDLVAYQCLNWAEGESHGGDISIIPVDSLFDYISDAQNQEGYTDYRKIHIKNTADTETGSISIRPVLIMPEGLQSRLSVTIATGLDYDDMSNKPADELFSDDISASLDPDEYVSVWLKRTITAGGSDPNYYQGISIALTASVV